MLIDWMVSVAHWDILSHEWLAGFLRNRIGSCVVPCFRLVHSDFRRTCASSLRVSVCFSDVVWACHTVAVVLDISRCLWIDVCQSCEPVISTAWACVFDYFDFITTVTKTASKAYTVVRSVYDFGFTVLFLFFSNDYWCCFLTHQRMYIVGVCI